MLLLSEWFAPLRQIADVGGPVVVLLIGVAVLTLAVTFYKIWQFWMVGVGHHDALKEALRACDSSDQSGAQMTLDRSTSYIAPVMALAIGASPEMATRLEAEMEARFARLESGFRFLDSVAQLAPLLGLFGTVLGMIEAFQSLQDAGAQVDPSILAGGIWVALLTTAVGLVVAMPTSVVLSWLEGRMEAERVMADLAVTTILHPADTSVTADPQMGAAHG